MIEVSNTHSNQKIKIKTTVEP